LRDLGIMELKDIGIKNMGKISSIPEFAIPEYLNYSCLIPEFAIPKSLNYHCLIPKYLNY
jgi:hypothetical protein